MISPMCSKWFHLKLIDYEVYSCPYLRVSATRNSNITSWQLTIKIINFNLTEIRGLSNTHEFQYSLHDFRFEKAYNDFATL